MKKIIITSLILLGNSAFAQSFPNPDPVQSMKELAKNTPPKGDYNSSVSNVFVFCSGSRPSKLSPLRPIYDQVCPNKQQKVSPPVLIDQKTGQQANFNLINPTAPSNIKITPPQGVQVQNGIAVNQNTVPTLVDPTTGKVNEVKLLEPNTKIEIPLLK